MPTPLPHPGTAGDGRHDTRHLPHAGLAGGHDPSEPGSPLLSVCNRILSFELPLLVLVAPLLLFPRGFLPLIGLVAILLLWLARLVALRRVTVSTPLDLPMLILLLMALEALYPSVDLALSLPKLYGIVLGVAVYFGVVNGVRRWRDWWLMVATMLLATVAVAGLGLVSTSWITFKLPGGAALYSLLPRLVTSIDSSFGTISGIHPNELGGTLAFLLLLPLGILFWTIGSRRSTSHREGEAPAEPYSPREGEAPAEPYSPREGEAPAEPPSPREGEAPAEPPSPREGDAPAEPRTPRAARQEPRPPQPSSPRLVAFGAVAALLLAGPVLVLTQSRSALIGFGLAAALLLGLRWRRTIYLMGAVALAAIAFLASPPGQQFTDWALATSYIKSGAGQLALRQEFWSRALFMIQDFPFTGIGLNTFPKVLDNLYPTFLAGPDAGIPHAHNIYLQTAVDLGLAGLMAFVGIVLIVGRQAVRAYRQTGGSTRGALAGLAAGGLAYLIYGVTDAITLGAKPLVLLWLVVGLIVAAARPGENPEPRSQNRGLSTQHSALRTEHSALSTQHHPLVARVARELGSTLWTTYWAVALLFVLLAYVVVGMAVTGWAP